MQHDITVSGSNIKVKVTNDEGAPAKLSTIGLYLSARTGEGEYRVGDFARLTSDDPTPDPDADSARFPVTRLAGGYWVEYAEPGSPRGVKNLAPGETIEMQFDVVTVPNEGNAPTYEHYAQSITTTMNQTATGNVQVGPLSTRFVVSPQ